MGAIQEKYEQLSKEVYNKYAIYLRAHRKATKHKTDMALQQEVAARKLEWLAAVQAKKRHGGT